MGSKWFQPLQGSAHASGGFPPYFASPTSTRPLADRTVAFFKFIDEVRNQNLTVTRFTALFGTLSLWGISAEDVLEGVTVGEFAVA